MASDDLFAWSDSVPTQPAATVLRRRGTGRGSKFFVLDRRQWAAACKAPSKNPLNLLTAMLVLLAGTGADHRLTKWSAKACEHYAGMGKPRARVAIDELEAAGILSRTEVSSSRFPQYRFETQTVGDPIFLPMQMITGFSDETPILRRVRQTGDEMLLQMLIDLYGQIQTDITHGIPLGVLRQFGDCSDTCVKVCEIGVHTIWALSPGNSRMAGGEWFVKHRVKGREQPFWSRVQLLESVGAIWFEPWVFDSDRNDAEPLFSLTLGPGTATDEVSVAQLAFSIALMLVADRPHQLSKHSDRTLVILPAHHAAPTIRGVARLRVEADTPGRRFAYGARIRSQNRWHTAYAELLEDLKMGRTDRPLRVNRAEAVA